MCVTRRHECVDFHILLFYFSRWPLRQRPDNGLSRGLLGLEYDRINISDSDSDSVRY